MKAKLTKATKFEVIHFGAGEVYSILSYALGEDGIIYELAGGKWAAYPIEEGKMRDPFVAPPPPPPNLRIHDHEE